MLMKLLKQWSLILSLFLPCWPLSAMEAVEDGELAEITGMEGVQLTLRLRNNVDANGDPIGCSGNLNNCRMGLEFSGREGIWLMLKDYYGVVEINDVRLEGSVLPSTNTPYFDVSRFLDSEDGECLIFECNPAGTQAVRVTYPEGKAPGEYSDLTVLINIGRTALEYDDALTSTPGYMRDAATGSVLGFRMADSRALNAPSQSRFDGAAYVFGF